MQYLVIFTLKKRFKTDGMPADFKGRQYEERAQGQALYAQGALRQSWALDPATPGAVCLFEAASPKELQGLVESFPFVKNDYTDYRIWPLRPDDTYTRAAIRTN